VSARIAYPVGALAAGLFLWEVGVRVLGVPPFILPRVSGVLAAFATGWRELPWHTWVTFVEAAGGFLIAAAGGMLTAVVLVYSRRFEWTVYPYVIVLRTVPVFALAPLLVLWFGFGLMPKVVVAAIISFFPVVVNMARGLRAVDPRLLELMDSVSATRWQVFAKVRFMTSLPYLFASFKIAITSAVVGAIVGEFIGADQGLGHLLIQASTRLDTELLFMVILVLAAMGMAFFALVTLAERKLVHWAGEGS
jgi:NitT/TauT family transport system permease protein